MHTARHTPHPCCLHNKLCLCLQRCVDNTLVNIDCSWGVHYCLSCVYASTEIQGQDASNNVFLGTRAKKNIYIYLQMEKFILGMNFCGMNDEIRQVIGFYCQGCPLVSDNFIQLATATKRVHIKYLLSLLF